MTNIITASVSVTLSMTQKDTSTSSSLTEQTSTTTSYSFTHGTGVGQVNGAYHNSGVIPVSGSITLDLANLSRIIYNAPQITNFDGGNIKGLVVANTSNHPFRIAATGSSALTELFNGSGNLPIYPDSAFCYINETGISVSDGADSVIQLLDLGSSSVYDFAVIGVTGTS